MSSSVARPVSVVPRRERRGIGHLASAWIPVAFCIFVIACESTVYFGADHTSGPLRRFCEFFFGHFTEPQWSRLHLIIRKCGHFTGYGLLSISWFRAFWMTFRTSALPNSRLIAAHSLAMLGTLLVASGDEFHQTFLANRSGSLRDVLVDCSGAALMQVLVWLWMRKRFRA
jgi:VanZ family protein